MSGFEIAGLVLGAIPLLISALENYKAGKGAVASIVKWRGQLDTLIFRLKNQKMTFYFDILELLRRAEVDEVADRIDLTEEECLVILQDAKKGVQLQDYLGIHYDLFLDTLKRYEGCLRAIAGKLRHIQRLPNAEKDDLAALLAANPPIRGKFAFKERLSFSIERGRLNELVEELKEDRLSLKTIIKGMKTQQEYTAKQPSHDSQRLATILGQVQTYAKSLFMAMCQNCTCKCNNQHKVMLQLHNRIPVSKKQSWLGDKTPSPTTFNVVFDLEGYLQEACVKADLCGSTTVPSSNKKGKQVAVSFAQTPAIVIVQESKVATTLSRKLAGICDFTAEARLSGHILKFTLNDCCLDLLDDPYEPQRNLTASTTLEEFLRNGALDEDCRMTPKQQTLLALDIASSIIQLRQTSWLSRPFSSKVVKFLVQKDGQDSIATTYDPFIEQVTDPQYASTSALGPDPKRALLELAILLLEIWHHRPFAMWCAKCGIENAMETAEARTTAAVRWLEMTSERLPPHHLTAIEQCLAICSGRLRFWHDNEFLRLYCENVIKPLQESCRAW